MVFPFPCFAMIFEGCAPRLETTKISAIRFGITVVIVDVALQGTRKESMAIRADNFTIIS